MSGWKYCVHRFAPSGNTLGSNLAVTLRDGERPLRHVCSIAPEIWIASLPGGGWEKAHRAGEPCPPGWV